MITAGRLFNFRISSPSLRDYNSTISCSSSDYSIIWVYLLWSACAWIIIYCRNYNEGSYERSIRPNMQYGRDATRALWTDAMHQKNRSQAILFVSHTHIRKYAHTHRRMQITHTHPRTLAHTENEQCIRTKLYGLRWRRLVNIIGTNLYTADAEPNEFRWHFLDFTCLLSIYLNISFKVGGIIHFIGSFRAIFLISRSFSFSNTSLRFT